jgi:hypothetical protein
MQTIRRIFSWYSDTFRKQKIVGKVGIGCVSLLILCCLCSVPIAILNPSTPTHQANNTSSAAEVPSTPVATQTEKPTEIPTNTPLPSATPEPFEYLKRLVAEALGTSNRDVPRLTDFSWDADRSEIAVTFAAQDDFTEDMIKRGIQIDIVNILRTIQKSNTPIPYKSIVVVATFPLVDVYGNTKESNVVIATYARENLDKVNWDNFLTDNIYKIANQDSLFIHPAARP